MDENYFEQLAGDYCFYFPRKQKFNTGKKLPFKKSPTPFYLNEIQIDELNNLGKILVQFMDVVEELYQTNDVVKTILQKGKPDLFLNEKFKNDNYLFYRPDLILTDSGFKICEIETSPFGLGLSAFLNDAYQQLNYEMLPTSETLKKYFQQHLPKKGLMIYSEKTKSYREQLQYLADKVISINKDDWAVININDDNIYALIDQADAIYRCFYLDEYLSDSQVNNIIKYLQQTKSEVVFPSLTPFLEEKSILGLLWDERLIKIFHQKLGESNVHFLQKLVPTTWILNEEKHCIKSFPAQNSKEFSQLPQSQRKYVLKVSGFSKEASWAEGVHFLHQKSQADVEKILNIAQEDKSKHYVLQEFIQAKKFKMKYVGNDNDAQLMMAKIRLTPYFSAKSGDLLTIKVTGCENTDYIHATSVSINTSVARLLH
jgi:hypothetical protein